VPANFRRSVVHRQGRSRWIPSVLARGTPMDRSMPLFRTSGASNSPWPQEFGFERGLEERWQMKQTTGVMGRSVMTLVSIIAISACATMRGPAGSAEPQNYRLVINNRSDFEVVVYALQSASPPGYRLTNARSLNTTSVMVPRNALTGANELVLRLHAIGENSRGDWVSQPISMQDGLDARLDIRTNGFGDLGLSMFSTMIAANPVGGIGHR
jgi:hypothetical protein